MLVSGGARLFSSAPFFVPKGCAVMARQRGNLSLCPLEASKLVAGRLHLPLQQFSLFIHSTAINSACSSSGVGGDGAPLATPSPSASSARADERLQFRQNSHRKTRRLFPHPLQFHRYHDMREQRQKRLQDEINAQSAEKPPAQGLFAKFKYHFKRYWYIAIPVHCACCAGWLAGLYFFVKSGIDVVHLLELAHLPNSWIIKVQATPPSAGYTVVALLLYKIATPLRYATTLAFTLMILRFRRSHLQTSKELRYRFSTALDRRREAMLVAARRRRQQLRSSPANGAASHRSTQNEKRT